MLTFKLIGSVETPFCPIYFLSWSWVSGPGFSTLMQISFNKGLEPICHFLLKYKRQRGGPGLLLIIYY